MGSSAVATNAYDAYGVPAPTNSTRFQYTGQIVLPGLAGLYHYKARIYNPALGRFMQTDPVGYKDDLDLYAYVGNDPYNRSDPTGEATFDFYPNGKVVVVQEFDNRSHISTAEIESQASKFNGPSSSGHVLTVIFRPGTGSDAAQIFTNRALDDTGDRRSHTNDIGGRRIDLAPNAFGAITVGHELGHILGAGDQYKNGVGANRQSVQEDVPGSDGSIMRDYGGLGSTMQTRDEILNAASQPNNTARHCATKESSSCK